MIPCRPGWMLPLALFALLALLLTACGDDGAIEWRGATIDPPEDWTVFEEADTRLSMANVPLGEEADLAPGDRPDGDVVGLFFTHVSDTTPGKWREFIEDREDPEIHTDQSIEIDEVPATRLIYSHVSNQQRTREMVVVVPSRQIEIFAQPVPEPGDAEASEMFMRHLETLNEVIEGIQWGPPVG